MKKLVICFFIILTPFLLGKVKILENDIIARYLDCNKTEVVMAPFEYIKIMKNGTIVGYAFYSDDLKTSKQGFYDTISLFMIIKKDGTLVYSEITEENETGTIFKRVRKSDLLFKMQGMNISKLSTVDAVAGATVSSTAVKNGVIHSIEKFKNMVLN